MSACVSRKRLDHLHTQFSLFIFFLLSLPIILCLCVFMSGTRAHVMLFLWQWSCASMHSLERKDPILHYVYLYLCAHSFDRQFKVRRKKNETISCVFVRAKEKERRPGERSMKSETRWPEKGTQTDIVSFHLC